MSDDDKKHIGAKTHLYADNIPDENALEKLHNPIIKYDKAETERRFYLANEMFGDIIPIELIGVSIWAAVWDRIVFWRGATNVLYDLVDRPEFLHSLMKKIMSIEMNA